MDSDPDKCFILSGIEHGFELVNDRLDSIVSGEAKNSHSAEVTYRSEVEAEILKEIHLGRYEIVYDKPKIISPISVVPKDDGSIRLIHDCSQPEGRSVNSYALPDKHQFASVDKAVAMTNYKNYMCKVDLKQAYRHVPISKFSQNLTGLKWKFAGDEHFTYLRDRRLVFGGSLSVGIFHRITQSVCRILKRHGINAILCYIDDFYITAPTFEACQKAMNLLIHYLIKLGFSISWHKCISPTQCLVFLGVEIDSAKGTLSIPAQKVEELKAVLHTWSSKTRASKKELQSLLGKLNWIARVVHAVRPTVRRLIDIMTSLRKANHRTRITRNIKRDITTLIRICSSFNGTCNFLLNRASPDPATIYTDSSLIAGGAALIQQKKVIDWTYITWSIDNPVIATEHINTKELQIVLLAIQRWSAFCQDKKIRVFTDNTTTLHALNKGSVRNVVASDILREIFMVCAQFNIKLVASYIWTRHNLLADSISRLYHLSYATFAFAHINCTQLDNHMSSFSVNYLLQEWTNKRPYWILKSKPIAEQRFQITPNGRTRRN